MRRSAKGRLRLGRMPPRHDVALTGLALALGTRRSLGAARFLVEAGRDEAASNMERQALLFGEMQRPAVAAGKLRVEEHGEISMLREIVLLAADKYRLEVHWGR